MSVHRLLQPLALLLAGLVLAPLANAIDLVGAWRAAQENDLEYAAARSAHEAGEARRAQGTALWRPSVDIVGTAGRMSSNTQTSGAQFSAPGFGQKQNVDFNTSINNGNTTSWTVAAHQALISGARSAQSRELELAGDLADVQWQDARQSLMLRTAERYFDVVVAEETLRVLREEQGALERSLAEAQEKFKIGDSPITDANEAQARALAAKAQVFAAETDLQVKQFALADVTGIAPQDLHPRIPPETQDMPRVAALDYWMSESALHNPALRIQAVSVEMARQGVAKSRLLATPSLDLVAKVGRDRLSGRGDFGPASNAASSGMIGVQLTIPVFTGGYRSAQHDEALSLAEKARLDEARARQQVALQTRAAWLGLTAGADRVAALAAAREASRARLDATRLGQEVGDRSTLDLLNAQTDAASAELALLQARIGIYTDRLRLAGLAGALEEDQLQVISAGLLPGDPVIHP
jgi:outer membrane protein